MNRITLTLIVLICSFGRMRAQSFLGDDIKNRVTHAIELKKANKADEALKIFLSIGNETERKRSEEEREVYVLSQIMACRCYLSLKQYGDCFELARKLKTEKLTDDEKRKIDLIYVKSGYFHVFDYMHIDNQERNYKKARDILEDIVKYADEKDKKTIFQKIYYSFYFEGVGYEKQLNYSNSIKCYQKALSGFKSIKDNKNTVVLQKSIARNYEYLFDFSSAKENYMQALVLAKECNDESNQMIILKELWNLANTVEDMNFANECSSAIDSLMSNSTKNDIRFDYYIQKGKEAQKNGLNRQAELWYKKGCEIAEKNEQDSIYRKRNIAYLRLRELYISMERYEDALVYGRKIIAVDEKPESLYDSYISMADINRHLNRKEKCYAYLDTISGYLQHIKEPEIQFLIYVGRARCHSAFKEYKAALDDYKKADEVMATIYPPYNGNRMALLALIGGMEYRLGNYAVLEDYFKKYAEYTKELYGEQSLKYINSQIHLANAKGGAGNVESGCNDYANAIRQLKQYIKDHFPLMGEEERKSLWSPIVTLFTWMTPYAIKAEAFQMPFTQDCYDALVMSKAFLLDSERTMAEIIKSEGSDEEKAKYTTLAMIKNQIKALDNKIDIYKDSILSLSQKYRTIEKEMLSKIKKYKNQTDFMDIDYNSVKQALKQNEILIDFTDYVSETKGRRYAAFVINKTQKYPLLKSLFDERQMDSLDIVRPDMYYDADYASDVLRLLWAPFKDQVTEGSTVYYVPSQLLFQVSLESLPLADGSLLGSHYNFVRLSSARELVAKRNYKKKIQEHTAVLYGGLQYDLDATVMAEESKKYDLGNLITMRGNIVRGDSVFHELNGAKEEVVKIESILKNGKWNVTSYVGRNGTEESFLNMHGKSPKLLHLATHGFYHTPSNAEEVDYLKGYTDAMSLSGIVLSGGNAAWLGRKLPEGVLGGILTANDIARLDLSGTDMVVLSACQTGQGEATSEGLYGLQRAFKKAGVGTIVMSLWNVDDKVTSEFMVAFYEQLTDKTNNWNKRKAFEQTKEIIRKKHPNPYYWAAFVMLDR